MTRGVASRDNSTDGSGLLLVQYFAPKEFFVLDGNPEAGLLMGFRIQEFRGQELEEIWPHARSSGLMKCLFEIVETGKPFDTTIGIRKLGTSDRVLRVRGLPISGDRVILSFREVTDHGGPSET